MEATSQSAKNLKQTVKIFEEKGDIIRNMICSKVNDKSIIDDIFQNLFLSFVHRPIPSGIESTEAYLKRCFPSAEVAQVKAFG